MLVEAALDAFAEHGLDGVGTRDLAQRSQVSATTLFHHFATKEVQRPDVVHSALAHSDDLVLIEIVTPARYSTTMADAAPDAVTVGAR